MIKKKIFLNANLQLEEIKIVLIEVLLMKIALIKVYLLWFELNIGKMQVILKKVK